MNAQQATPKKILLAEDDTLTLMSYALKLKEIDMPLRTAEGVELSNFAPVYNGAVTNPVVLLWGQHEMHFAAGEEAVNKAVMGNEYDACILDFSIKNGTTLQATKQILAQQTDPLVLLSSVTPRQQLIDIKSHCNAAVLRLQEKDMLHMINMKSMTEILGHLGPMIGLPSRGQDRTCSTKLHSNTIK